MPAQDDKSNLHRKPTQEELQANALAALEEAEKLDPDAPDPDEEDEEKPAESESEDEENQEQAKDVEDSETPSEEKPPAEETLTEEAKAPVEEKEPEKTPEKPTEEDTYKKRYADSTRQARITEAKNRELINAIDEGANLPEPTEDELREEYADWDVLSDTERRFAKDSLISTRRFLRLEQAAKGLKKVDAWKQKVDDFLADPQTLIDNPDLEGKQDDFKFFVTNPDAPNRTGADFDILVGAFLNDVSRKKPEPKKGQMFEVGTCGDSEKPRRKTDKLTIEQGAAYRKGDPKKLREKLKEGKIDFTNI